MKLLQREAVYVVFAFLIFMIVLLWVACWLLGATSTVLAVAAKKIAQFYPKP